MAAVNAFDNVDPTPASYRWTVVEPDTTIVSGPPLSSRNTTAEFHFSSTDLQATYECQVDGAATWGSCDSHLILEGLTIGTHSLVVRARSLAGTVDPIPATYEWTVVGPDTTIVTGPPASTVAVFATFTFSSDEPTATFECALDNAAFGSCETPYEVNGLTPGTHELLVRARNLVGGVDPTPASYQWTVESLPETTLLTVPENPTDDPTATFTFSSDKPGATFECALDEAVDDEVFSPCTSPHTYTQLIFGTHDFAVRAVDAAATSIRSRPCTPGTSRSSPRPSRSSRGPTRGPTATARRSSSTPTPASRSSSAR